MDFGQDVNRTRKRPKSGLKGTLVEEYEDEAAERKAKTRKQSLSFGDFPGPGPSRRSASCVGMEIMSRGRISETVPSHVRPRGDYQYLLKTLFLFVMQPQLIS